MMHLTTMQSDQAEKQLIGELKSFLLVTQQLKSKSYANKRKSE